ncbi:TraR/DksA C4-type zinc finger protein [Paraclostridium ghonii]|uniref:RNA polymerase-binding transcription factor DksA n=1 Tax=Paraclostridium ghonii TaxID=29358 RepID=A0ABU0MWV7_9FIRM|nr:TraR/DksA C4-type zinc finger protein [Paeniclostridium ghonii]MDQ0554991.1 RNA polymerase-binding transcription factor DksA [Paeniclostridium ghonii]
MNNEKYEKILKKEKNNITKLVYEMEDNTVFGNTDKHTSEKYTSGELSSYDNHLADIGSEVYMQEMQNSLTNHEKFKLNEIDNALYKIKNGSYGVCESCKKNIEEDRLDFIPETRLCLTCAKKEERPVNNIESVSIKDNFSGPNLYTREVKELVDMNRDMKHDD